MEGLSQDNQSRPNVCWCHRQVLYKEGEELKKQIGAVAYVECSAKTQQNVKAVFDAAIKVVLRPPKLKKQKIRYKSYELQKALEKTSMANKTVIITIVNKAYVEPHENEHPTMFDLFLEGFWAGEETKPLVNHLLVVSMDKAAHERCEFRRLNCYRLAEDGGSGDDLAGEKVYMTDGFIEMMWKRTLFLLDVLKRGYNFIFTDTDVLWLRNPFTRLSNNETLDLQISTDVFNGNSSSEKNLINTGFYFIRSNKKTISLFEKKMVRQGKKHNGLKKNKMSLVNLVRNGVLAKIDINTRFLDTLYFNGFCKDNRDVRQVATVHANRMSFQVS
ncbi:hypothetical protein DH2020_023354 [Rehmannia glutinosa]|uniref:Nucleotide-diphospho-sugar transferase domain-containing protein n=1 Tax=Rehmannia glutinosa TaxID=99300 RepID=A0ABR0W8C7_REHGL